MTVYGFIQHGEESQTSCRKPRRNLHLCLYAARELSMTALTIYAEQDKLAAHRQGLIEARQLSRRWLSAAVADAAYVIGQPGEFGLLCVHGVSYVFRAANTVVRTGKPIFKANGSSKLLERIRLISCKTLCVLYPSASRSLNEIV